MLDKITSLGDFYGLKPSLRPNDLLKELERFSDKWNQYNEFKPWIPRQGLCIINEDGVNKRGPALSSLPDWNKKYKTNFKEYTFNKSTPVLTETSLNSFLSPIRQWCYRSHFLKLLPGGFFPPHRDKSYTSVRLIVPIANCNPPYTNFILEDKPLHWEYGRLYFVNTLKEHTLFNSSLSLDSIWLVLNFDLCEESVNWVHRNLAII